MRRRTQSSTLIGLFLVIVLLALSLPPKSQAAKPPVFVPATRIYWTDAATNKIQRSKLDGTEITDIIATGLTDPIGIAVDVKNNKLYWSDNGTGKIQRSNLDGTNITDIVTGISNVQGIATDLVNNKIYWTETGKVRRANLDGTGAEDFYTSAGTVSYVNIDPVNSKIYWTGIETDSFIKRANLDGSAQETILDGTTDGISDPLEISIDPNGGKIYWADNGTKRIKRANLDGTSVETLQSSGVVDPVAITLDIQNSRMYWTDDTNQKISGSALTGGSISDVITSGLTDPRGLTSDEGFVSETITVQFELASSTTPETNATVPNLVVTTNDETATGEAVTVEVQLQGQQASPEVSPTTANPAATPGVDFTLTGTVNIPVGTAHNAKIPINLVITDDEDAEGAEDINLVVGVPANNNSTNSLSGTDELVIGSQTTHTLTIQPSDNISTVEFSAATGTAGELTTPYQTTVKLNVSSGTTASEIVVPITATNGTATSPADFSLTTTSVTFPSGSADGATQTVDVAMVNDQTPESDETFTLGFGDLPGSVTAGTTTTQTVTIVNNGVVQTVSEIYWVTSSNIEKINPDGTGRTEITSVVSNGYGLALDRVNGNLYWTEFIGNSVRRAGLDGSNPTDMVTGTTGPSGVGVDPTNGKIYWTGYNDGADLKWANLDGSNPQTIVIDPSGGSQGIEVAVDPANSKVYWASRNSVIHQADLDGSNVTNVVTGESLVQALAIDGTNSKLYWGTGGGDIKRSDLNGSNVETVANVGNNLWGMDLDLLNGKIYWVNPTGGTMGRLDLNGSNPEIFLSGLTQPWNVEVNNTTSVVPQTVTVAFEQAVNSTAETNPTIPNLVVTTSNGGVTGQAATVEVTLQAQAEVQGAANNAATQGSDFTLTGTVNIPAGTANNATVPINLTIIDDIAEEPAEDINLQLGSPNGATVGSQSTTVVTIEANDSNFLDNGGFGTGDNTGFFLIGGVGSEIVDGVLRMTRTDPNGIALLAQPIGITVPQGTVLRATIDMGNSAARSKYVTLRLTNKSEENFQELYCLYSIPGNTPLNTYTLTAPVPSEWTAVDFNVFVDDFNEQWLLLDNLGVKADLESQATGTNCTEPKLYNQNYLNNGDFLNGEFAHLFLATEDHNITNEVLNMTTTFAGAPGQFSNAVRQVPQNGEHFQATLQIGNPSGQDRIVDVRMFDFLSFLNDGNANNFIYCRFTVPAYASLQTYTVAGSASTTWKSMSLEFFVIDELPNDTLQFDNLTVVELESAPSQNCVQPSLLVNTDFSNGGTGYIFAGAINQTIENGVFKMTRTDVNSFAAVSQDTQVGIRNTGRTVNASVDLGNETNRAKYVTFRIWDGGSQESACLFTVPPGAAGTYTLSTNISVGWANLLIDVFVDDFNEQWLTVDNFSLAFSETPATNNVVCTPNLPVDSNMVINGDFTNGEFGFFFINEPTASVSNGQLAVNANPQNPNPAMIANPLRYAPTNGQTFEASLDVTNNSTTARQVDMRLFDFQSFLDDGTLQGIACSITVPAGQTVTYTFSGNLTANWKSMAYEMFVFGTDANPILLDNLRVVRKSAAAQSNNNCPPLVAPDLAAAQQKFEVPAVIDNTAADREEGRGGTLDVAIVDEPIIPDDEFPTIKPEQTPAVSEAETVDAARDE